MARRHGFGKSIRDLLADLREDGNGHGRGHRHDHGRSLAEQIAELREESGRPGNTNGPGNGNTGGGTTGGDTTGGGTTGGDTTGGGTTGGDTTGGGTTGGDTTAGGTTGGDTSAPTDNLVHGTAGDDVFAAATGEGYNGEAGFDTLDFSASTQAVSVDLGAGTYSGQFSGTVLNVERVVGTAYDDTLTGDAQANVLEGGAGNDRLQAGAGADTMTGGAGKDTFVLAQADTVAADGTHQGFDVIKDFSSDDTLDMSSWFPNGVDPFSDGDIIDQMIKFTAVNGGTMVQAMSNGVLVDVAFLEGVSPGLPSAWASDSMLYVG